MLALASALANQGCRVDVVLASMRGHWHGSIPENVGIHELSKKGRMRLLYAFIRLASKNYWELLNIITGKLPRIVKVLPAQEGYLRSARPDVMLSTLPSANIVAAWAVWLSGRRTKLVLREANHFILALNDDYNFSGLLPGLARKWYRTANRIITVSYGVRDDLISALQIPEENIIVIHNPVDSGRIRRLGKQQLQEGVGLGEGEAFVLAAGRLEPQKDYNTLLKAYASCKRKGLATLVILGEGSARNELHELANDLGVFDDLVLPGHVDNPYAFMGRASVFVLSAMWEGCPNVLLEALACGCRIISTDCPSGPGELLDNGRYGVLIPVGDVNALAAAIDSALAGNGVEYDSDGALKPFMLNNVAANYLANLI